MSVQLTHLDITGQVISSVVLLSSSIVPLAPTISSQDRISYSLLSLFITHCHNFKLVHFKLYFN